MVTALFPNFLRNDEEYEESVRYWVNLWNRVDEFIRTNFGWSYPWVGTGSPLIKDGNPIFSVISPGLRRGVRIIQAEPIDSDLDIQVWLDTFGGDVTDPTSIHELVIACVLSEEAARIAFDLISEWIQGLPVSIHYDERGDDLLNPQSVIGFESPSSIP